MTRLFILAMLTALITASCRKEIKLDLHNASGLIVMEGSINNQAGPYYVRISKTVTYYDSSNMIPVSGAKVIMSDDAGYRDSMTEAGAPGQYQTGILTGTVGHIYHLSVNAEGKQYDAYSTMPAPVTLDSIGVLTFPFGNRTFRSVYGRFKDAAAETNYYKLFMNRNYKKQSRVNVTSDKLSNGNTIQANVNGDESIDVRDTIQVELDAIDKPIFDYWSTLNSSTLSSQTAAPANPVSNWSNNGLGYFSAYALTTSHHIVVDQYSFHRID